MFLFLVPIVLEDALQFRVLADLGTLVVPVHRLQLFHQGHNGPVHVACCRRQIFYRLVITDAGHFLLLMMPMMAGLWQRASRHSRRSIVPCGASAFIFPVVQFVPVLRFLCFDRVLSAQQDDWRRDCANARSTVSMTVDEGVHESESPMQVGSLGAPFGAICTVTHTAREMLTKLRPGAVAFPDVVVRHRTPCVRWRTDCTVGEEQNP
ncbi:hypothetical protein ACCAA_130087 [Candidatus Accumulibacter aalborgensis]|uniref:Uncharacterized protein n=1 Tax=Candidatus Accumulibacter aalborgensis TaxID=1860102 RepID=A0A1A8XG20_9PROT|nr:hypothetical protein ACCAA_130087 [Candidatus Accumulibacter aalborgensis]